MGKTFEIIADYSPEANNKITANSVMGAKSLQVSNTARIIEYGSPVELPPGVTNPFTGENFAPADFLTKPDDLQPYTSQNDLDGRDTGIVAVFVFFGEMYQPLQGQTGKTLTFQGAGYRINALHPDMKSNICTQLAVACMKAL